MKHPITKVLISLKNGGLNFKSFKNSKGQFEFVNDFKKQLSELDINNIIKQDGLEYLFGTHDPKTILRGLQYSYKDGFILVSYGKSIQSSLLWNELTKKTRGVIVDTNDFSVVSYPFDKFFNIGEFGIEDVALEKIPTNIPFGSIEKLDGAIGILYKNRDGSYAIATKGSFFSDEAIEGTKMLNNLYKDSLVKNKDIFDNNQLFFEIINSNFLHVIKYDINNIFLIGGRNNKNGKLLTQIELDELAKKVGFPRPKTEMVKHNSIKSFVDETSKKIGIEGYVLYFDNGLILKVKTDDYRYLHKINSNFSMSSVIDKIRAGIFDEFVKDLDEEFKEDLNKILHKIRSCLKFNFKEAHKIAKQYFNLDRRSFFELYDSKLSKEIKGIQAGLLLNIMRDFYNSKEINIDKMEYYNMYLKNYINPLKDILTKPELKILVGIPGSGKSTIINSILNKGDVVISTDEIRKELTGGYENQSKNEEVIKIFYKRVEDQVKLAMSGLFNGKIILDSTSVSLRDREGIAKLIHKYGIKNEVLALNIHPELAILRDVERKGIKEVGENVIYQMFNRSKIVSEDEGFDRVINMSVTNEYIDNKIDASINGMKELALSKTIKEKLDIMNDSILPHIYEFVASENVEQKSEYHNETVQEHIKHVISNSITKGFSNTVIFATLFHDLGKIYARRYNPEFGRFSFEGHGDVSVKILDLFYKNKLVNKEWFDYDNVKTIVKHHNFFDRLTRKIEGIEDNNEKNNILKNEIDNFVKKEGISEDLKVKIFEHWMCDNEGAERGEVQMNDYRLYKDRLIDIMKYEDYKLKQIATNTTEIKINNTNSKLNKLR